MGEKERIELYRKSIMGEKERIELFLGFMNDSGSELVSEEFLNWLKQKGFFTAPASTSYHGAYAGGLFDHSLEVANKLVKLTKDCGIEWGRKESPFLVGMFHDLCKIDEYTLLPQEDSTCVTDLKYAHATNVILGGHGAKSVMFLSQFMTLTYEEILCIKFHMGAYVKDTWDEFDLAIKEFETVLWTHTADMYAAKVLQC